CSHRLRGYAPCRAAFPARSPQVGFRGVRIPPAPAFISRPAASALPSVPVHGGAQVDNDQVHADLANSVPGDLQLPPGPPAATAGNDDGYHPAGVGVDHQVGVVDDAQTDPLVDINDLLAGQVAVPHGRAP